MIFARRNKPDHFKSGASDKCVAPAAAVEKRAGAVNSGLEIRKVMCEKDGIGIKSRPFNPMGLRTVVDAGSLKKYKK